MKFLKSVIALLLLAVLFPPIIPTIVMGLLNVVYEAYQEHIYFPLETWAQNTWYGRKVVDPISNHLDTWV